MSKTVVFKLSNVQLRTLGSAIQNKSGFNITLTKKQVAESGGAHRNGTIQLPLTKPQLVALKVAREAATGMVLVFNSRAFGQRGGFIPLLPLLIAAIPGLAASAPDILKSFAGGYKNLAKLSGIKVDPDAPAAVVEKAVEKAVDAVVEKAVEAAAPVRRRGGKVFGESVASDIVEFVVGKPRAPRKTGKGQKKGSSLKIHGESLKIHGESLNIHGQGNVPQGVML